MFSSAYVLYLFLFLANYSFITSPYLLALAQPTSHITILGSVYCDVCYDNTFSKHSYLLPGVDVHVECKFKANAPRTTEQISFSVNRSTDRYGMYKVEIPSVDGVDCTEVPTIHSFCQASLITTTSLLISAPCNIPTTTTTSTEITVKIKQDYSCIYTLGALSYKPPRRNVSLCGKQRLELEKNSWTTSKYFLPPYIPPYVLPPPWTPLPQFPPLTPNLPTSPNPPSLPFPFPPVPPFTPPPPAFNLGDPRSTWIPNNPVFSPPPPPVFNFWDPRTWIPHSPPSSPTSHLP